MRQDEPLRDVFWLIGLQVGVLLLASAVTQRALHFVNFMFLGVDYLQYFDAARAFLEGKRRITSAASSLHPLPPSSRFPSSP